MADAKARVQGFYDNVLNEHNLDAIDDYVAADCVEHTPPPVPDFQQGAAGVKQMVGMWFKAFSNVKVEVHELIGEGNTVAARITWSGKHTGSMMGEVATGKDVQGHSIEIIKMNDAGKMTDHWAYGNDAEVFMSLGVQPPA